MIKTSIFSEFLYLSLFFLFFLCIKLFFFSLLRRIPENCELCAREKTRDTASLGSMNIAMKSDIRERVFFFRLPISLSYDSTTFAFLSFFIFPKDARTYEIFPSFFFLLFILYNFLFHNRLQVYLWIPYSILFKCRRLNFLSM